MHYDQALAAVAVVSKELGKALSEGDQRRRDADDTKRSAG
jgi:hypothetical protein